MSEFYVYALIDPRDGEVFYVGKGKGARMHDHTRAARKGRKDANELKKARIRSILDAGLEPFPYVVEGGLGEQAAIDVEHKLIVGMDHLTNIMSVGWARSPAELERIRSRLDLRAAANMWHTKRFSLRRQLFLASASAGLRWGFTVPGISEAGQWEDFTDVLLGGLKASEARLLAAGYSREWLHGRT